MTRYFLGFLFLYSVLLLFGYWNVQQDDAYIFYTYAKNIASGNGYVFNEGERINATTSPLYTIFLASLCYIVNNVEALPLLAHISGALFLFFTAVFLFKIFDREELFPIQYYLPVFFLTNPLIRNGVGMETFLTLFLIVLTLYFYMKDEIVISSFIAGLTFLARFDSVILLVVLLIHFAVTKKSSAVIQMIAGFIFTTLPWFLFSYFYFGELIPSTVRAKLMQQATGYWGNGLIFLNGIVTGFPGGKLTGFFYSGIFLIAALFILIKRQKIILKKEVYLIFIWMISYLIIYSFILNLPPYPWYLTPLSILFALTISLALQGLTVKFPFRQIGYLLFPVFLIGAIFPIKTMMGSVTPKYIAYKEAAFWINQQSEKPVIAIDEIGVIGFYLKDARVRDVLGLINPEAVGYLQQKDFASFLKHYSPDYIVADYPTLPKYLQNLQSTELGREYLLVKKLGTKEKMIGIYQKNTLQE